MNVDELIARAWKAVEKAGVPETAQPMALHEAVTFLRESGGSGDGGGGSAAGKGSGARQRPRQTSNSPESAADDLPDEDTFFATLASESGVKEEDLRDVLLYKNGKVTVPPPTRNFGTAKSAQAKNITALVAGARAKGLGESPVKAEAVRDELKRKQCWDATNFAAKHLGALQGFNGGSDRTEITATSKWVGEFKNAVAQALGTDDDDE
jgi:hypothetical protein